MQDILQTNMATWDRIVRAILGIGLISFGIKYGGILCIVLSIGLIFIAYKEFGDKINKMWFYLVVGLLLLLSIQFQLIWFIFIFMLSLSSFVAVQKGNLFYIVLSVAAILFVIKFTSALSLESVLYSLIGLAGLTILGTAALGFCPIYEKYGFKTNK